MHPRDWFNNGQRIRENVQRQFEQKPVTFAPRDISTFKVPDEFLAWYNANVPDEVRNKDRYDLCVLVGPTKLGKTQLVRSLSKHLYWKGQCKLNDLLLTHLYKYIVIDDIEWEYIPNSIKKSVLLGTGECIVTDKYVKKLRVNANLPCIYVCNPAPDGFTLFFDRDTYWQANTCVIQIKNALFYAVAVAAIELLYCVVRGPAVVLKPPICPKLVISGSQS